MIIDFNVKHFDYEKKIGNLAKEAVGKIKSEKHFPIFNENGKEVIFKPLSKTKPLSTPLFAYSEVLWSHIIKTYFDEKTPLYHLAVCEKIEELNPKYYHHGTYVESIVSKNEDLVNLLEYYLANPHESVKIASYINYCEKFYDYSFFFATPIFQDNKEISENFALQILLSLLKADQNFHYENVAFKTKGGKITQLAPSIDHEFSTMFLYADDPNRHNVLYNRFLEKFKIKSENSVENQIFNLFNKNSAPIKNLDAVVKHHPDVAARFLKQLQRLLADLKREKIFLQNKGYMTPFNSNNYEIGELLYKENNELAAKAKRKQLNQYILNLGIFSNRVNEEIIETGKTLERAIRHRLR